MTFPKESEEVFFQEDITLNIPVYLDQDVKGYLSDKAEAQGVNLQQLVNEYYEKIFP